MPYVPTEALVSVFITLIFTLYSFSFTFGKSSLISLWAYQYIPRHICFKFWESRCLPTERCSEHLVLLLESQVPMDTIQFCQIQNEKAGFHDQRHRTGIPGNVRGSRDKTTRAWIVSQEGGFSWDKEGLLDFNWTNGMICCRDFRIQRIRARSLAWTCWDKVCEREKQPQLGKWPWK